MQYSSFRQRWATGLMLSDETGDEPRDGAGDGPGFEPGADRLWTSDSTDTKFGEFAQTDVSGHLAAYSSAVKTLAAIAQINPNILTGDLINVSAEGLASLNDSTQRRLNEYELLFGEAWEAVFRLAAQAAGQPLEGPSAAVRWRDTEARSLAATVDALGKLRQTLDVPVEALWERVPGVTNDDVDRWRAMRDADPLHALTAAVTNGAPVLATAPDSTAPGA
ncbi:phage portal protein [Agromyces archimandritae]|uniref:Phage portal protein n=2 Tax=Agromyces archimandritae TaxID=2781962 RepID=A0A975FQ68_9MICO|nr:phage portal protein [Agromyces archimandritae]